MPQEQIIAYKTIFDSMMKGISVKSFDEYFKSLQMSKSVIKKDNWHLSSCTCGEYMKEYICTHIIANSLKYELCEAPIQAKTWPLGEKRKCGRPS